MEILLQVILILVNAFFAGTEMAVVSLNATKLRKMQEEGDKIAGKLLSMVEDSSAFLSTIQVAITLAGYLGAAFAGENFAPVLSSWLYNDLGFQLIPLTALNSVAIIIITIILSYFTLVFGELVPKRIALQKSYEWAKMACGVIRGMAFVLRPVIWLLSVSVNGVLRLLHMKVEAEEENVTEDEIRMMVDLGGEKGAIDEDEQEWLASYNLLTAKPVIFAANVSEDDLADDGANNEGVKAVREYAASEDCEVFVVCAEIEEEISQLDDDEKAMFLEELGLKESGLEKLIRASYHLLGLISYLTAGEPEVRAWTIKRGTKAPQAAGKIHTDFERGFIRAEVVSYDDLMACGTHAAAKEKGLVRLEGKEYVVQDGDIMLFRFNV